MDEAGVFRGEAAQGSEFANENWPHNVGNRRSTAGIAKQAQGIKRVSVLSVNNFKSG